MTDHLLPCPFCGGPVYMERTVDERKWYGIVCRNTLNRGGSCAVSIRPSASEEAAVERWNKRAWQACVARTVPDEVLQATIDLVEGLPVHDWRNASGMRIKDHKSWVRFYCAAKNVLAAAPEGKK